MPNLASPSIKSFERKARNCLKPLLVSVHDPKNVEIKIPFFDPAWTVLDLVGLDTMVKLF